MSHTSAIKAIQIQSISALRSAITELNTTGVGLTLIENAVPRAYFANQQGMGKADYVVQLSNCPYDIGLYKNEQGGYEARTDFFAGHVAKVLGAACTKPENREQAQMGKLFQMYAIHAATEVARRKGHSVRRITKADGTVQLEVTGAGL